MYTDIVDVAFIKLLITYLFNYLLANHTDAAFFLNSQMFVLSLSSLDHACCLEETDTHGVCLPDAVIVTVSKYTDNY